MKRVLNSVEAKIRNMPLHAKSEETALGRINIHEFRHNIVKVAVDPQGDSRVDPQTILTMLW